jgi:hypothetical protein
MRAALAIVLSMAAAGADAGSFDALALRPGAAIGEMLAHAGHSGTWRGRQFVIDGEALDGVLETQRIVMTADATAQRLAAIHVQIFAHRGSSEGELLRLADEVRRRLTARFGAPEWEWWDARDRARVAQWRLDEGPVVRAGVPERFDGRRAIEIAITPRPFPRNERFWGAEDFAVPE